MGKKVLTLDNLSPSLIKKINPSELYFFYRKVTEEVLNLRVITNENDCKEIENIYNKAMSNKGNTLQYQDLNLFKNLNLRNWINLILFNFTKRRKDIAVQNLVNDFTFAMHGTRMTEENKYVLCIVNPGKQKLILCHSQKKTGVTETIRLAKVLLDSDNILRFIHISLNQSKKIEIIQFVTIDSKSFAKWLGVNEIDLAIDTEEQIKIIGRTKDLIVRLAYSEQQFDKYFIKDEGIKNNKVILKSPIKEVLIDHYFYHKKYSNSQFEVLSNNIKHNLYRLEKFHKIYLEIRNLLCYHIKTISDTEHELFYYTDNNILKSIIKPEDIIIVFFDENINYTEDFLFHIKNKIQKDEKIQIYFTSTIYIIDESQIPIYWNISLFNNIKILKTLAIMKIFENLNIFNIDLTLFKYVLFLNLIEI